MNSFQSRLAQLDTLEQLLPRLLSTLTLGRAQIALDQIRGAIEAGGLDRIVFLTVSDTSESETADSKDLPIGAAIAVQQPTVAPSPGSDDASDVATIIHAGPVVDAGTDQTRGMAKAVSSALDDELRRRGVVFLQWATDAPDVVSESVSTWCDQLDFKSIGTLDYLHGPVPASPNAPFEIDDANDDLTLALLDWERASQQEQFAEMVESTYAQTLDCPGLATYRSAAQTLGGYQSSNAFAPDSWFNVLDHDGTPIGCVILAKHVAAEPTKSDAGESGEDASSENKPSNVIIEIVYMGLIPEARGKERGKIMVQRVFDLARAIGSDRIILAVDQRNKPARAIYDLAGLEPMLSETVWVKSLA